MPLQQVLAVQDADGRPIIGMGYDPVSHQFTANQGGPAVTDATTGMVYSILSESPLDGYKATYSAAKVGLVPAASATDIFTVTGAAGVTVRVLHIEITATTTAATAAALDVLLLKRSTANTGGTSTGSPTPVPHDRLNAPGLATVLAYTVNPTTGNLVGTAIRNAKFFQALTPQTATDFPANQSLVWDFGNRPGQGIVLRGVNDVLAINLNAASASAGALFDISVEYTEDTYS